MVICLEQRAIALKGMVKYEPLWNLKKTTIMELEENIMVLNNVTKFHKILIKTI